MKTEQQILQRIQEIARIIEMFEDEYKKADLNSGFSIIIRRDIKEARRNILLLEWVLENDNTDFFFNIPSYYYTNNRD